jgi:hypothetical protein
VVPGPAVGDHLRVGALGLLGELSFAAADLLSE